MITPYPGNVLPLTSAQREARFGHFDFSPDPQPGNPEHVRLEHGWAEQNVVGFPIPQLLLNGRPRMVWMNHLAKEPMLALFAEWERLGLMPLVLTFDGGWVPRFKRQPGTYEQRVGACRHLGAASLSNHCWGTALDVCAKWNPLGSPGAPAGAMGSTVELRDAARRLGWFAGADFRSRPDAMHFELGQQIQ